jgi:diguanylate cyclase (GGDEF)-like protein
MVSGARSGDEIGRYGGEEFLFILQNTDIAEAQDVAQRVREHIASDEMRGRDVHVNVTLSLGIAQARNSDDVDALIDRADAALYAAKLAGRNCVRVEKRE